VNTPSSRQLNIPALLGHTPLFQGLATTELADIAKGTRELALSRGEVLFHRGTPSDGFFLLIYGQIKLSFISPQGSEKVVELIGPKQTFGEAVMFMDKPYPVTATALADCQLIHISKTVLFAELDHDPALARKMLAGMSMKLHRMLSDVESYSLQSARERVIGYLLREIPEDADPGRPVEITLSTSKGTIASRLNITQEHFSRTLHELAASGLIVVTGRNIKIPDIESFRRSNSPEA
jgi:CRP/FNR family transcriptional regulator, dissimilatory nitrate respiration regulator